MENIAPVSIYCIETLVRQIITISLVIGSIINLISAGLCAYLADKKQYKGTSWFFIGLFSGILGLILMMKKSRKKTIILFNFKGLQVEFVN